MIVDCDDIMIVMITGCDDIMIMMISWLWWYQDTERRARWRFNGTNVVARRANCQRHITCWESTNPTHCVSSLKSLNSLFEKNYFVFHLIVCRLWVAMFLWKRTNLTGGAPQNTLFKCQNTFAHTNGLAVKPDEWVRDARRKRPITVFLKDWWWRWSGLSECRKKKW